MAKGFKHGAGGAPLNFKLVGNPQPANPRENTIWVNTDARITGWVFSATEPEAPAEGMVWIQTGRTSLVKFNMLKRNTAMVYPLVAWQYGNGTWEKKPAQTFQNDKWNEWVTYLFYYGNKYEDITGGWTPRTKNGDAFATIGEDAITFRAAASISADKQMYASAFTTNKIDVSHFTRMKVVMNILGRNYPSSNAWVYCGLHDAPKGDTWNNYVAVTTNGNVAEGPRTVEVDLTNVTGAHYVGVTNNNYINDVTEIILEC